MKEENYRRLYAALASKAAAKRLVPLCDRILTISVEAAYICVLLWAFFSRRSLFFPLLIIPAAAFVFVTALRAGLNRKRPYEVFGTEPLIEKKRCGKSFPSRHVASAFVIGTVYFLLNPVLAVLTLTAGAALAFLRVAGGVHFVKDVLAGAAIGAACGVIGIAVLTFF